MRAKPVHATRKHKCPVCGHDSWCQWWQDPTTQDTLVMCMRVSTGANASKRTKDGNMAHYHSLDTISGAPVERYFRASLQASPVATAGERDKVYRDLLTGELLPHHRDYYLGRNLDPDQLKTCLYTSLPIGAFRETLAKSLASTHNLKGIPGFWYTQEGTPAMSWIEGVLLPVRNSRGQITGCQVHSEDAIFGWLCYTRKNQDIPEDLKPRAKYMWLSSAPELIIDDITGKEWVRRATGTGAEALPHFSIAGLEEPVYVVEGVLKADTVAFITGHKTIGQPGVGVGNPIIVQAATYSRLRIAYDMDWVTNPHVKLALIRLIEDISTSTDLKGVDIVVWDPALGKGFDDFLLGSTVGTKSAADLIPARDWLEENKR